MSLQRRHFIAQLGLAASLPACGPQGAQIAGGFVGIDHARGHALRVPAASQPPAATGQREHRTRVLIIGAGVAGLAAARALRQRGIDDHVLLELEDRAGGNSRAGRIGDLACPLGAHYLPVPGDGAPEVQDLLSELGLATRGASGGWRLNAQGERHLCHSPQERLFFRGQWQEGLLPLEGVETSTLAQYQRMADAVARVQARARFAIPVARYSLNGAQAALDAVSFAAWLDAQGLDDALLRWYLDYCCRDDYGAGLNTVSAWAGLHYFASRHGFHAPGRERPDQDAGVLTWPEGNAWLTGRLAEPLGERLKTGRVVTRVEVQRHGVRVEALDVASGHSENWTADSCILAVPLFVAARILVNPPAALTAAARALRYAPWLVANLRLRASLADRPGAAPAWDNVVHSGVDFSVHGHSAQALGGAGQQLGYVNATHQSLHPVPGPTILTHYRAFGIDPAERQRLFEQPWAHWRDQILTDLSLPHPDIARLTERIDIVRYGHAMAVPTPGLASHAALQALKHTARDQRLHFAHADLSGYSVFEEAFAHGLRAGVAAA